MAPFPESYQPGGPGYGGKLLVSPGFPPETAKDIMMFPAASSVGAWSFSFFPVSAAATTILGGPPLT